ncbi:MAG: indole-3-glycerol phosphate synthase TrpC [Deinococcales bacterium]
MSTDSRVDRSAHHAVRLPPPPEPLTSEILGGVPGVLGTIARERAEDYRGSRVPALLDVAATRPRLEPALAGPGLAIIAEVKRASPSRGAIAEWDPVDLARRYQHAGAAAISVLTEPRHFRGSLEHLRDVADAVQLPILRKDFVVHPLQVVEARAQGASAVLLIAAVLGPALRAYLEFADALGLDALVEVHDEEELAAARAAGVRVLGVNNRDLRTLQVDLRVAPRLLGRARDGGFEGVGVAESGYASGADVAPLHGLADAVLVGSSLAASADPGEALAGLLAAHAEKRTS